MEKLSPLFRDLEHSKDWDRSCRPNIDTDHYCKASDVQENEKEDLTLEIDIARSKFFPEPSPTPIYEQGTPGAFAVDGPCFELQELSTNTLDPHPVEDLHYDENHAEQQQLPMLEATIVPRVQLVPAHSIYELLCDIQAAKKCCVVHINKQLAGMAALVILIICILGYFSFSRRRIAQTPGQDPNHANTDVDRDYDDTVVLYFENESLAIYAAIAPRIAASFSILGSLAILYMLLSNHKRTLKRSYNRIILGMTIFEVFNSLSGLLSTAPSPNGSPGIYGAIGNTATCTAQGFLFQLGLTVPLYNCILCLFYLLSVTFRIPENTIARCVEPFLHAFAVLYGLSTSVAGVLLDLYNPNGMNCWIEPFPKECAHRSFECTRGGNALTYQFVFGFSFVIFAFYFITFSMIAIFCTIRSQEISMTERHALIGTMAPIQLLNQAKETKRAAKQTLFYVGAFFITYIWPALEILANNKEGNVNNDFTFTCAITIFVVPLQGFWNFLIYMAPRYGTIRDTNKDRSWVWIIRIILNEENSPIRPQRTYNMFYPH